MLSYYNIIIYNTTKEKLTFFFQGALHRQFVLLDIVYNIIMQMTVGSCKPFIMMFKNISAHVGKYILLFFPCQ